LTCHGLQKQSDWSGWLASEAEKMNSYNQQGMFGTPCASIFIGFGSIQSSLKMATGRKPELSVMAQQWWSCHDV
jgi:hypothetical protein